MVKLRSEMGKWKDEQVKKLLFKEECPNPECTTGVLVYPTYMVEPHCPECKTFLLAGYGKFDKKQDARVSFHLGE